MNHGFPEYDDVDSDGDLIEDYEETQVISKKDWFKPASVSLARLDRVKPVATVYNLGLRDPRDLQAGRGKPAPVTATTAVTAASPVAATPDLLSGLQAEPPLSTLSYQKAAWGSQTSIPEVLKQAAQAGTRPTRPSSAKTGNVTKPLVARKSRPQSAKDPLLPNGKKKNTVFGVKGQKCDPSERAGKQAVPPGGVFVGWAGPPAGLHDPSGDSVPVGSGIGEAQKSHKDPPPAPNTSPEPQDDDDGVNDTLQCSPPPSPGLHLSFSLPSADADADADAADEPDTGRLLAEADKFVKKQKKKESQKLKYFKADQPGPGRKGEDGHTSVDPSQPQPSSNLQQRDSQVKRQETTTADVYHSLPHTEEEDEEEEDVGRISEEMDDNEDTKQTHPVPNQDVSSNHADDHADMSLTLDLDLEAERKEELSEKPLPPSNGFDLEYLGPSRQEKKGRSHPIFLMPDKVKPSHNESSSQRPQSGKDRGSSSCEKVEGKIGERSRDAIHPLPPTAPYHKAAGAPHRKVAEGSRSGVHIREDRNITVDITPRNLGRKVMKSAKKNRSPDDLHDLEVTNHLSAKGKAGSSEHTPDLEVKATPTKPRPLSPAGGRSATPAATVSVVYDDDSDSQTSQGKKTKRKRRGLIKEKDLVTMVSNISLSDDDQDDGSDDDDPSKEVDIDVGEDRSDQDKAAVGRSHSALSKREQNYFELGRRQARTGTNADASMEEKENFITMTTKTILFDHEKPKESVVKTILDAPLSKPRDRVTVSSADKMATRPRSAGRPRSARLTKSDLQSVAPVDPTMHLHQESSQPNINGDGGFTASDFTVSAAPDEERPESRMGFVAMETDKGQREDTWEKHGDREVKEPGVTQRPPSGRRRPLSAASKAVNKPAVLSSRLSRQSARESVATKKRPSSASPVVSQAPSVADVQRANAAAQALRTERETAVKMASVSASRFGESRRQYASYNSSGRTDRRSRVRSASLTRRPVFINSKKPDPEVEDTEAMRECQDIQNRLACYGIDVKPQTLERALFPPTGRTLYYDIEAQLPKSFSHGLLSHPRYWLPEEHRRLKIAEKKLAMAELSLWRQKKEEEKKARLEAEKEKGNKKGSKKGKKKGKKKLRRSQSFC